MLRVLQQHEDLLLTHGRLRGLECELLRIASHIAAGCLCQANHCICAQTVGLAAIGAGLRDCLAEASRPESAGVRLHAIAKLATAMPAATALEVSCDVDGCCGHVPLRGWYQTCVIAADHS